jgi:hypothetical protein
LLARDVQSTADILSDVVHPGSSQHCMPRVLR